MPFEHTQHAMLFHAVHTEECRALAAEGNGLSIFKTALAHCLHLPLHFRHFLVDIFHPLHEERALQLLDAARGKSCVFATLRAGEGPPSRALRQRFDTRPTTVVVIAGVALPLPGVSQRRNSSLWRRRAATGRVLRGEDERCLRENGENGGEVEAVCESCLKRKAVAFCRQCTAFLCADCVDQRQVLRVFEGHKVESLASW